MLISNDMRRLPCCFPPFGHNPEDFEIPAIVLCFLAFRLEPPSLEDHHSHI